MRILNLTAKKNCMKKKYKKNIYIIGKSDHKTFKFVSNKLMEIVGIDNFDLEFSRFFSINLFFFNYFFV
jgi:hypothetical protein